MTGQINLECLLPKTQKVLNDLAQQAYFLSDYVLVGGSALSLRLCHRLSEDLDFFAIKNKFDKGRIYDFFRGKDHEIINDDQSQIDLIYEGIKITFFSAGWDFLKPERKSEFNVASLGQLAGMKAHTLFLRAAFRDYYDLYALSLEMSLDMLYRNALIFLEGLNYKLFSMALIYVDDIEDDDISHLNPVYKITKEQISEHFIARLKE